MAADARAWPNLIYATLSLALGFAAWGLVSAFASPFRGEFGLSAHQTAFLVAVPVLLGALAGIPMRLSADRFGGRVRFSALFVLTALAAASVPTAASYRQLLVYAFLIGLAGSSFAIGVGFTS